MWKGQKAESNKITTNLLSLITTDSSGTAQGSKQHTDSLSTVTYMYFIASLCSQRGLFSFVILTKGHVTDSQDRGKIQSNLPKTKMNDVLRETTQKTCSYEKRKNWIQF